MKIPPQAKRVFKGEIFEVWQWEQKMYDGTTAVFEMLKRPDTVQVIPVVGRNIWLTEEEQPHHKRGAGFFGGRVDEGEEPLAAAKRELLEESGLRSDDWELYKSDQPVSKMEWTVYYFIARNCRKAAEQSLDNGEKIAIKEANFDEFIDFATAQYGTSGALALDLMQMQARGQLDEFKKKLWG